MADRQYSLDGDKAESVYDGMAGRRQDAVDTAREMAELTIPSVFPPEGYKTGDRIPGNNQSVGAWAVNNLASNLMFMGFPPGRPMLRFEPIQHALGEAIKQDPQLWSKVKLGLSRKEVEHRARLQTTPLASAYVGSLKQLLVAGNVLWQQMSVDAPLWHRMDKYVVRRDAKGNQLLIVLKEMVSIADLSQEDRGVVHRRTPELLKKAEWEQEVHFYTVCKLHTTEAGEKVWLYWQEYDGELLPGTEYEADFDQPPLFAAWLIPVYGENWGRSYCEEYQGDLYTIETSRSSLNDGAAIASLSLLFVRPGSATSIRAIKEAENLAVMSGLAEDVSAFRLEKGNDFAVVERNLETATRNIARAFLTYSSIQRNAERVTREEWVRMAQEIDRAMGGLYTELAQSYQKHIVLRFVFLHEEEEPNIPSLPPGIVRVLPVTGLDALGSTTEADALVKVTSTVRDVYGPETLSRISSPVDFARRLSSEEGLNPEGLFKDEQQIAQDQAQAEQKLQQKTLLEKGTGPVAGAAAKSLGDALTQQAQPQPQPDAQS